MSDIFQSVYQHPQFSTDDIIVIAKAHQKIEITKGHFLLKEGETANEYFLLEKGLVRAFVHDYDNNEITTEFFVENEIVIVPASLFQRNPAQETLQTVTDCVLWKISFNDFQYLFHSVPGFSEWGRLWFTNQVFSLKQKSLDIVTETATNRYLKLLKEKTANHSKCTIKTDCFLFRNYRYIVKQNSKRSFKNIIIIFDPFLAKRQVARFKK